MPINTLSPDTDQDAPLRCPSCRTLMRKVRTKGLILDACPGCEGVWFDSGELKRYFGRRAPKVAGATDSGGPCPRCQQGLKMVTDRGTDRILEVCDQHGVFASADTQKALGSGSMTGAVTVLGAIAGGAALTALALGGESSLHPEEPPKHIEYAADAAELGVEIGLDSAVDSLAGDSLDASSGLDAAGDVMSNGLDASSGLDAAGDVMSSGLESAGDLASTVVEVVLTGLGGLLDL